MEKYKALIVEDVKDTSDYILKRIKTLCPAIGVIEQALTIDKAAELIQNNNYHIVFLDIQMPTGTSFDLLQRLSEKGTINFEIIFITGESAKEFTLRAIKYSALDFLYKPLDDGELVVAVNKAIEKLKNQNYNQQIKLLLNRMNSHVEQQSNKIAFHLHNGIVEMIDIDNLIYLQADGVVSKVYLKDNSSFSTNRNLGFYKEMLIIDYNFFAISNSVLVNTSYIKRYSHRDCSVTLTNNTTLTASKRAGKELKEMLLKNQKGFSLKTLFQYFMPK